MIMNYLVVQGYQAAAEQFQLEVVTRSLILESIFSYLALDYDIPNALF